MQTRWHTARIFDAQNKPIGCVRLPDEPHRPRIILWGNRYFRLLVHDGRYMETPCYLVPIENMYAPEAEVVPIKRAKAKP